MQTGKALIEHFEVVRENEMEGIIPSVINPSITVKLGFWSVSMIRQDLSSKWDGDQEHALLILQGCYELTIPIYRIELISKWSKGQASINGSYFSKPVAALGKLSFKIHPDNPDTVQTMIDILLWRSKKDILKKRITPNDFPKERLVEFRRRSETMLNHKTWLITDGHAQILLRSVYNDINNTVRYEMVGNNSYFTMRGLLQKGCRLLTGVGSYFSARLLGLALPDEITIISRQLYKTCPTGAALYSGFILSIMLMTASLIRLATTTIPWLLPTTELHSCYTWAREKLLELNIEEINNDLPICPNEWIAAVPSQVIGKPEKQSSIPEALLIKGVAPIAKQYYSAKTNHTNSEIKAEENNKAKEARAKNCSIF